MNTDMSVTSGVYNGVATAYVVLILIVCLVTIVSYWKIFEKAGIAGWKALVPIYNCYLMYDITMGNGWLFLLLFVPVANVVINILQLYKLALAFGKGIGFFIGLWFLEIIFLPILAFDGSEYEGVPG